MDMKKSVLLISTLLLMLSSGAWAQDTKIETGIIAYDRGEYDKALDFFN
jgi:hypothetical protein